MAASIRSTATTLEPGEPTALFQTRKPGGGQNVIGRSHQYDVASDGLEMVASAWPSHGQLRRAYLEPTNEATYRGQALSPRSKCLSKLANFWESVQSIMGATATFLSRFNVLSLPLKVMHQCVPMKLL